MKRSKKLKLKKWVKDVLLVVLVYGFLITTTIVLSDIRMNRTNEITYSIGE